MSKRPFTTQETRAFMMGIVVCLVLGTVVLDLLAAFVWMWSDENQLLLFVSAVIMVLVLRHLDRRFDQADDRNDLSTRR
jgi:biotin transporter BioY